MYSWIVSSAIAFATQHIAEKISRPPAAPPRSSRAVVRAAGLRGHAVLELPLDELRSMCLETVNGACLPKFQ